MCKIEQYTPRLLFQGTCLHIIRDTYKYIFLNRKEIHCFLQFSPSLDLK